jgi:hypothetical protein
VTGETVNKFVAIGRIGRAIIEVVDRNKAEKGTKPRLLKMSQDHYLALAAEVGFLPVTYYDVPIQVSWGHCVGPNISVDL